MAMLKLEYLGLLETGLLSNTMRIKLLLGRSAWNGKDMSYKETTIDKECVNVQITNLDSQYEQFLRIDFNEGNYKCYRIGDVVEYEVTN